MTRPDRSRSDLRSLSTLIGPILLIVVAASASGCNPDESPPLKEENERLRKQAVKKDSVIVSLQEGNKVMQQQFDLLNRDLREAMKETKCAETARSAVA